MAAPPSLNLLGEIGLLSSLVSWSWFLMSDLFFFCLFLVRLIHCIYIPIVSKVLFIPVFIPVL